MTVVQAVDGVVKHAAVACDSSAANQCLFGDEGVVRVLCTDLAWRPVPKCGYSWGCLSAGWFAAVGVV